MYSEVPFDARIGTHTRLPKFVSGVPSNEQLFRRDLLLLCTIAIANTIAQGIPDAAAT